MKKNMQADFFRKKAYICGMKLRKECNLLEMSVG